MVTDINKEVWVTDKIYVLIWNYFDNSAFGVERVYILKARAEQDMKLLELSTSSKNYQLVELEITK
jgi:hypothetical protein